MDACAELAAPGWASDAASGAPHRVRAFLDQYSYAEWPEVVKLAMLRGVVALQAQYPGQPLSTEQLRMVVERAAALNVAEARLPALQRQLLDLQAGLDDVYGTLTEGPKRDHQPSHCGALPRDAAHQDAGTAPASWRRRDQVAQPPAPHAAQPRRGHATCTSSWHGAFRRSVAVVAPKAPTVWRDGAATGFPEQRRRPLSPVTRACDNQGATNPIYPF